MSVRSLHRWVYLQEFRHLPDSLYPAHVSRADDHSLLWVDPRASRFELVQWSVDHLDAREQEAARAAYGQGPVNTPLEDWVMDGPCLTWLPECLRTVDYDGPDTPADLYAAETETA